MAIMLLAMTIAVPLIFGWHIVCALDVCLGLASLWHGQRGPSLDDQFAQFTKRPLTHLGPVGLFVRGCVYPISLVLRTVHEVYTRINMDHFVLYLYPEAPNDISALHLALHEWACATGSMPASARFNWIYFSIRGPFSRSFWMVHEVMNRNWIDELFQVFLPIILSATVPHPNHTLTTP